MYLIHMALIFVLTTFMVVMLALVALTRKMYVPGCFKLWMDGVMDEMDMDE